MNWDAFFLVRETAQGMMIYLSLPAALMLALFCIVFFHMLIKSIWKRAKREGEKILEKIPWI